MHALLFRAEHCLGKRAERAFAAAQACTGDFD
jgi:hypothetical protein